MGIVNAEPLPAIYRFMLNLFFLRFFGKIPKKKSGEFFVDVIYKHQLRTLLLCSDLCVGNYLDQPLESLRLGIRGRRWSHAAA